jgi:aminotransferase class I and II
MKNIEEYFVPWVNGIPMYVSDHIEKAWRDPSLHRMMSNENPLPPSDKVLEAMIKYGKMANRYPDQGLVVRTKIAEINNLDGPGNVMIGNGSSEVYDNIFRMFIVPQQDEVIQHTPCFAIYQLRGTLLGAKMVSVPMIYKDSNLHFDADGILNAITDKTKIIVVANPNNPTGNFMAPEHFVRIAETGIPFVIDEAYVEYAGLGMSQVDLTKPGRDALRVHYCGQVDDRPDRRLTPALECWHDSDVGCAGRVRRHGGARGTGQVQQRRRRFHHRIPERDPRLCRLPLQGELHPVRLRRHRKDRKGSACLC